MLNTNIICLTGQQDKTRLFLEFYNLMLVSFLEMKGISQIFRRSCTEAFMKERFTPRWKIKTDNIEKIAALTRIIMDFDLKSDKGVVTAG